MEVSDVLRTAIWLDFYASDVLPKFQNLVNLLKHNAEQSNLQPVAEALEDVATALAEMPTRELSTLQMSVLERLSVADLVGKRGRRTLNTTIKNFTYDPASTYNHVADALNRLNNARSLLRSFTETSSQIGFDYKSTPGEPGSYLVNVIFKNGSSISNVSDWKTKAADWELIVSGAAGVVGERPEETSVVSVANGSLILTLSASPIVTKVLATISKHIASIANDYLDFKLKREELERSKMMTRVIRDDLAQQEKVRRSRGKDAIIEAVQRVAPDASKEAMVKLERAVERHIAFSENGGEVDYVTPAKPNVDSEEVESDESTKELVNELRELIEEYRAEKQEILLLTHTENEEYED